MAVVQSKVNITTAITPSEKRERKNTEHKL